MIYVLGFPGSGKTQAILKMLSIMCNSLSDRYICLDRLGEILEKFADDTTLVYNQQRRQGRNFVSC
ncbi:type IV secretion system DNA-binding domain-containing protein [uncultured Nostoc sp.]|uniref:type IV secretion system DNA-binding domain-containing protein n=1 Tax=uncultured Nostoc sp. TaxID=340711 RepID=UPI0035CABC62